MKFTQSVKLLTSLVFLATSKIAYADEEEETQFKPSGPIVSAHTCPTAQLACEGLCFQFGSTSNASNQRFFVPVTENTFDVSLVKIEASGDLSDFDEYLNYFVSNKTFQKHLFSFQKYGEIDNSSSLFVKFKD